MDIYVLHRDMVPHQVFFKKRPDGDFWVVANKDSKIFYLNKIAIAVYEKIDGEKSIDELKNELLEEFEITEKKLEGELLSLLRNMQRQGIIGLSKRKDVKNSAQKEEDIFHKKKFSTSSI